MGTQHAHTRGRHRHLAHTHHSRHLRRRVHYHRNPPRSKRGNTGNVTGHSGSHLHPSTRTTIRCGHRGNTARQAIPHRHRRSIRGNLTRTATDSIIGIQPHQGQRQPLNRAPITGKIQVNMLRQLGCKLASVPTGEELSHLLSIRIGIICNTSGGVGTDRTHLCRIIIRQHTHPTSSLRGSIIGSVFTSSSVSGVFFADQAPSGIPHPRHPLVSAAGRY